MLSKLEAGMWRSAETEQWTFDKPASEAASQAAKEALSRKQWADALKELPAIPIYFASSYSLVKPYVVGFDNNLLDAPSLKRVRIDTTWQAPKRKEAVWLRVGE